ncbi:MAG: Ig-like domain-containing protein [Calditrichaeota bacterium]|nr:Ig-like domain-containing protein [Calditrichota bacterium]
MGPPGGGPKDEEAPRIIEVNPPSGSTEVDPESTIEITFSEPVNRESLESALFITPSPEKKPKIRIKGNRVIIRLREVIPSDRTLLISVGTDLTDLQRNRLERAFTIALTAGTAIDSGKISGRIFSTKDTQGMLVGAWLTSDSAKFNPVEVQPDFITQAGLHGEFALEYMPPGSYRLICCDDRDHDMLYDPAADRLGLPWQDVTLDEGKEAWMALYPVKHDTSRLRLFIASANDNQHLVLRYNRNIDLKPGVLISKLAILDSSGSSLSIERVWLDAADSSRLVIYTDRQFASAEYSIIFADDTTAYSFTGSTIPDTSGPVIIASSPSDGARSVSELPSGWIAFDDMLADDKFTATLSEIPEDSTQSVTEYILDLKLEEVNILGWKSTETLAFGKSYTLEIDPTAFYDRSGNVSQDTAWSITFSVIDPVETGSISGKIEGQLIFPVVGARSTEGRHITEKFADTNDNGTFTIDRLNAGEYMVWAFSDLNRDQIYYHGSLEPFRFSERFTISDDTVKVRSRWETAGTVIRFK